jgi:pimeloyl-ACP methyl ester carboxylesterase
MINPTIRRCGAILFLLSSLAMSQYQGPVPAISDGYGAPGGAAVAVEVVQNSHWPQNPIVVFHPKDQTKPVPTIFYAHGYGGNDTLYQIELLRHIASRGYAAVYVPYKSLGVSIEERYATLLDGFRDAVRALPHRFDTTRVGFYGHSFGGGALPYLAYQLLVGDAWGSRGKFLLISAPWYSFRLGDSILRSFPRNCPLVTMVYDEDVVNDHRLGMDVFRNIAIPDSLKDFLVVRSDSIDGYVYQADHNLPGQNNPKGGEYDALDSRVVFRMLDALADLGFENSSAGRRVALGGGDSAQVVLGGGLAPMEHLDQPATTYPKERYQWPCDTAFNPRRSSCSDPLSTRRLSIRPGTMRVEAVSRDRIRVSGVEETSTVLRTPSGQILTHSPGLELSLAGIRPGLYVLQVTGGPAFTFLRSTP